MEGLDLADLMSALTASQQVKASVKLSDRNVVELVNKLKQVTFRLIYHCLLDVGSCSFTCHACSWVFLSPTI